MASITALTLVNRVRRRAQLQSVSAINDQRSDLVLDLVNEAKNEVLETRIWPFDVRHDGVLTTRSSFSGTSGASVGTGSTANQVVLTNFGGNRTDVTGDLVSRLVLTSSSSYGNTALRVDRVEDSGSNDRFHLSSDFPDVGVVNQDWLTFVSEYLLPETVRSVFSVRYQEEEVALSFVDPALEFDQLVPRPLDEINDDLRWVGVGGFSQGTYDADTQSSPSERKLRMVLYPVPDSALILHYSYVARHPDLTSATDTLDDVPAPVVDEIVHEAYARYQMTDAGNDAEVGVANQRSAAASRRSKHRSARHDPFRRKRLQTLDGIRGPSIRDRLPSPFGASEL